MKNLVQLLCLREIGVKNDSNISIFCEHRCASDRYRETKCLVPETVRSTFVVAFSPCGELVASAHGDHQIYIFNTQNGHKLKTLTGHLRTPWTLVWHPINGQLLASGCLAGEIRIWFLTQDNSTHNSVVIYNVTNCVASLAFHPFERILVIASSNEMHYWDWSSDQPFITLRTNCEQERVRLVRWSQTSLITGISNLPQNIHCYDESFLLSQIYRSQDTRLQSIIESIDRQLISSNESNILSSLLTLQSLLQSTQQFININEIKIRIIQIVEKLLLLSPHSHQLNNQIRQQLHSTTNDNDNNTCLTHCLWLTQKAIQLSRLMSSSPSTTITMGSIISRSHQISLYSNVSTNSSDFRLQCWRQNEMPNLKETKTNIIAAKVRIHNDASVDISRDGQLLVCLVPNLTNCVALSLYSLSFDKSFGHLLCQWSFGSNAISVSLSPTSQYIVVGISSSLYRSEVNGQQNIGQIFKRKEELLEHIRHVQILGSDSVTSVNSIRFMPNCGHGLVYGTNRGQLIIIRPDGDTTQ